MHFLNASGGVRFLLVPYFGYTQLTPATVAVPLLVVALLLVWLRAVAIGGRRARGCAAASPVILALATHQLFAIAKRRLIPQLTERLCRQSYSYTANGSSPWAKSEMFRRQVLTPEEAAAIVASVPADRLIHISDTAGPLPFFTVGPYWAYHKNKTGGAPPLTSRTSYERAMETEREYLKAAFGGLLEDVRDILEQSLRDGPVRFAPGLSLPGFHYIYSHAAWQHVDDEWNSMTANGTGGLSEQLPWLAECESRSRISFTLPLALPPSDQGEAGLNYVAFRSKRQGCADHVGDEWAWCADTCAVMRREVYKVGEWGGWRPTWDLRARRVTMQGFGIRCGEAWYLYW
ncbi:hypothetical protein EMIHUDRAFT_110977 [Emiliania huxleyi CCMP1516]|uniref:Uncharacterized protein n=2 Tax=Emiliania huxleyi TaxID=2903 RepID=A0A0D3KGQ4_EMIH1|nr:hypothetical protein EMIHUDRAFT_113128 [Emiliania huxleyi CCMP1516]XP_005787368.1 hypothetical protein EMIHUDRAFT_110977 [Emiliania huxleyi CCMP1516]EOD30727.1 hypothetical protein EMIHUDRAFT_113128 [Emiliania huxleyi CCMP1516]EOD34939.1 hypothetical protein EMIHUDRAFT_110977 [Emiliania huxleyi CCMP1516]|eukprot:XP_005783156.1 hypothetical protein EMIHUDRAFT_113128 [Emiliania huxleyi CCMP1516]